MTLHEAIMIKDDLTFSEAIVVLEEMRKLVNEGMDPEQVLLDEGLEPDYIFDLMNI